ncbi:hypothetical protein [Streptosporangium jomthongense]|uniref:Lipoprotein n=1 Tax=Streptosporangium jomthongense TaxID=1193683 RepID=A0ABV8F303_9ACTN
MRRLCGIVLLVIGVMSVTGCTPRVVGMAGISVDPQGHPLIVLAWCGDNAPEGASVARFDPHRILPAPREHERRDHLSP